MYQFVTPLTQQLDVVHMQTYSCQVYVFVYVLQL